MEKNFSMFDAFNELDNINSVDEAVCLNPSAAEPEDMNIQMELDDYDDNGEAKSFDAWDKSVDAYHKKDAKTWADELHRMERDPDQIDIREPEHGYKPEPMTHDDELEASQNAMKKYQADRAKRIAKLNAETDLFNLDFED